MMTFLDQNYLKVTVVFNLIKLNLFNCFSFNYLFSQLTF